MRIEMWLKYKELLYFGVNIVPVLEKAKYTCSKEST